MLRKPVRLTLTKASYRLRARSLLPSERHQKPDDKAPSRGSGRHLDGAILPHSILDLSANIVDGRHLAPQGLKRLADRLANALLRFPC